MTRPAPEGVRLILDDGTELPVECYYSHQDDGAAVWMVTCSVDLARLREIKVAVLPPQTGIAVQVTP